MRRPRSAAGGSDRLAAPPERYWRDEQAGLVVRSVRLAGARELLTVRATDPAWNGAPLRFSVGTIVRIEPPADRTDEQIRELKESFERAGAARVRVMPRLAGAAVVAPIEFEGRESARDVVMRIASEARSSNRQALYILLDRLMTEAGI